MFKIKKNDIVYVIAGKDKGKTGKTLRTFVAKDTVLVEGINRAKKHMRRTKDDQKGGVIEIERPIHVSNLKIFCKSCSKPARVGITIKDVKVAGKEVKDKIRICRRCKEAI